MQPLEDFIPARPISIFNTEAGYGAELRGYRYVGLCLRTASTMTFRLVRTARRTLPEPGWNRNVPWRLGARRRVEGDRVTEARSPGLIVVCFGRFWVRGLLFPDARRLEHPSHWKNTLP